MDLPEISSEDFYGNLSLEEILCGDGITWRTTDNELAEIALKHENEAIEHLECILVGSFDYLVERRADAKELEISKRHNRWKKRSAYKKKIGKQVLARDIPR